MASSGTANDSGERPWVAPDWATLPAANAGALLEVRKGPTLLQTLPLTEPALLLGRHPAAGLCLEHPSISRQHAAGVHARGRYYVVALGSTHGTFIAGRRLAKVGGGGWWVGGWVGGGGKKAHGRRARGQGERWNVGARPSRPSTYPVCALSPQPVRSISRLPRLP